MATSSEILNRMVKGLKGQAVNKFGYNNVINTGAPEDIASIGGLYPYATFSTAQTLEVISTSIADILTSGSGAWSVSINGLDANGNNQTIEADLNGQTAVALTGTWTAINRAYILIPNGSGGVNAGDINIQVASGGTIVSQIPLGRGQTQQCVYRVPADVTLRVTNITAYTDAATGKTGSMQFIKMGSDCKTLRVLSSGTITEASRWSREYHVGGLTIEAGEWAAIRALSVAQNATSITADFDGVLE